MSLFTRGIISTCRSTLFAGKNQMGNTNIRAVSYLTMPSQQELENLLGLNSTVESTGNKSLEAARNPVEPRDVLNTLPVNANTIPQIPRKSLVLPTTATETKKANA